jgi:hypothetical protein
MLRQVSFSSCLTANTQFPISAVSKGTHWDWVHWPPRGLRVRVKPHGRRKQKWSHPLRRICITLQAKMRQFRFFSSPI